MADRGCFRHARWRATAGTADARIVSVIRLQADSVRGAVAGWTAMASPSLLVILLVGYPSAAANRAEFARVHPAGNAAELARGTAFGHRRRRRTAASVAIDSSRT